MPWIQGIERFRSFPAFQHFSQRPRCLVLLQPQNTALVSEISRPKKRSQVCKKVPNSFSSPALMDNASFCGKSRQKMWENFSSAHLPWSSPATQEEWLCQCLGVRTVLEILSANSRVRAGARAGSRSRRKRHFCLPLRSQEMRAPCAHPTR